MSKNDRNALFVFPILIIIGFLVALAGSQGGSKVGEIPVFALSVGLAFLIQWLAFIPAFRFQTEKFFDLTGSITYISVVSIAVLLSARLDARSILLWALVVIWATRLGTFLFRRIRKAGKDDRFDELKPSFIRFLNVWTIQGLWVTFTMAAALIAITSTNHKPFDIFAIIGLVVWIIGFLIEVAADAQKSRFNANPENKGKFINTGLWSRSRHPNYFGDFCVWWGLFLVALAGGGWWSVAGPLLMSIMLLKVSGVALLEKDIGERRPAYCDYVRRTNAFFPGPQCAA